VPKIRSRTAPLRRAGDSLEMRAAVDQLQSQGVRFIRPTPFQLKIGDINFYPDTGTILLDGGKALEERGLPALLQIISPAARASPTLRVGPGINGRSR
jgi:hypothetical protein